MPIFITFTNNLSLLGYDYDEGGHAVAIIGYDKEGFIIRNSWGTMYGIDGYYHLKYEDFNNSFYEIWTMV